MNRPSRRYLLPVLAITGILATARTARAEQRTFAAGTLIIPMDLEYQAHGMFQSYGLLFQLLRQGVPVAWVIDPDKTWHAAPCAAPCDTPGDECPWDCGLEGSGIKCPYPTASPDFFADTSVVWDGENLANPGDPIGVHGYRGGPFVIDAAYQERALSIVDAWNDPAQRPRRVR